MTTDTTPLQKVPPRTFDHMSGAYVPPRPVYVRNTGLKHIPSLTTAAQPPAPPTVILPPPTTIPPKTRTMTAPKVQIPAKPVKPASKRKPKDEDHSTAYKPQTVLASAGDATAVAPEPVLPAATSVDQLQQPKTASQRKPGVMPSSAERARRLCLLDQVVFEHDVPCKRVSTTTESVSAKVVEVFDRMAPGVSFVIERCMWATVSKAITDAHARWPDRKYLSKMAGDDQVRVWRKA